MGKHRPRSPRITGDERLSPGNRTGGFPVCIFVSGVGFSDTFCISGFKHSMFQGYSSDLMCRWIVPDAEPFEGLSSAGSAQSYTQYVQGHSLVEPVVFCSGVR